MTNDANAPALESDTSPRTVSRRTAILGTTAAGVAIWAAPAVTSLSPRAYAASAQGCTFAVRAGQTVTFSNIEILNACDDVTLGYDYNGSSTDLDNRAGPCGALTDYPNVSFIAPVDGTVVPYLLDQGDPGGPSCDYKYSSTNGLHASCDGDTVYLVDSYFCQSGPGDAYPPGAPGSGNFNGRITVTVS